MLFVTDQHVLKIITNYYLSNFIFLVFNVIKKLKVSAIKMENTESLHPFSIIATNKLVKLPLQSWNVFLKFDQSRGFTLIQLKQLNSIQS